MSHNFKVIVQPKTKNCNYSYNYKSNAPFYI